MYVNRKDQGMILAHPNMTPKSDYHAPLPEEEVQGPSSTSIIVWAEKLQCLSPSARSNKNKTSREKHTFFRRKAA